MVYGVVGVCSGGGGEFLRRGIHAMFYAVLQTTIHPLHTTVQQISHPEVWKDYTGLVITQDDHLQNIIRARQFFFQQEMEKINKVTDRNRWMCSPAVVNAFYHPALNDIIIPAAFIQKPLYDADADLAIQYGSLAAMIGHDLSLYTRYTLYTLYTRYTLCTLYTLYTRYTRYTLNTLYTLYTLYHTIHTL